MPVSTIADEAHMAWQMTPIVAASLVLDQVRETDVASAGGSGSRPKFFY